MNSFQIDLKNEATSEQAYERVKADFDTLRPDEVLHVNVDIPSVIATVLGVLPEVRALRPQIEKELPTFDLVAFDKLEDYAFALSFTHTNYLIANEPPNGLEALTEEASTLRERMLAELRVLVLHGVINEARLENLQGNNGYKNLATDLQVLSKLMDEVLPLVPGKLLTTADDVQTGYRLHARLMRVVGLREQGPQLLAAATEERMRAFTLVSKTYEDARRAVVYLRAREGDADSITPGLYTGKGRKKQQPEAEQPPTPSVEPPSAGVPVDSPSPTAGSNNGALASGGNATHRTDPFL